MLAKSHNNHERSIIIPIKQSLSTTDNCLSPKSEYSLKQNCFEVNYGTKIKNFFHRKGTGCQKKAQCKN